MTAHIRCVPLAGSASGAMARSAAARPGTIRPGGAVPSAIAADARDGAGPLPAAIASPARRRLPLAWLAAACLLLAGCATLDGATARLEADKALLQAGRFAELAAQPAPCERAEPVCGQAQEIRGEACRAMAAQAEPFSTERRAQLECAVLAYGVAARALPVAARGQALRNLGAAANDAVTEGAGDPAQQAAAELAAGNGLLVLSPGDAEGCYYAGSAVLAQALMQPEGPGRCPALRALPAACAGAPVWATRADQSRLLFRQIAEQRQRSQCP